MTVPQRYGITFPFDGIPLVEQREIVQRARRPRVHRPVVGGVGRLRRVHRRSWSPRSGRPSCASAPRSCPCTRAARTRSRRRSRRCARPRRAASRSASARRRRDRRALERHARSTSRTSACATRSASCAPRSRARRSTEEYETFAVQRLPARHHGARAAADPRRRAARRHVAARGPRRRRRDHQLALGRRREDRRAARRRRTRRSSRASSCSRSTTRAWRARSASARSRRTSPCRCTPRSTSGSAAATSSKDLWRLWKEGDRKAAADVDPRPRRRRAARVGQARAVPRAHPALHRQRRHHARARAVLRPDQLPRGARSAEAVERLRGGRGLELHVVVADLREAQEHERAHEPPPGIDLAPVQREPRRRRRGVVVVVQPLAAGDRARATARSSPSSRYGCLPSR